MAPKPLPRTSPANRLRGQIEKAEADGVSREALTLRLTRGDVSSLKRDPALAVADISFADGVMWFIGVKIEEGGVVQSELVRS